MEKALIQISDRDNDFINNESFNAYYSLIDYGYEPIKITYLDLISKYNKDNIKDIKFAIGNIKFMEYIFRCYGKIVNFESIQNLKNKEYFYKRKITKTNLGLLDYYINGIKENKSIFVKPIHFKQFYPAIINVNKANYIDDKKIISTLNFTEFRALNIDAYSQWNYHEYKCNVSDLMEMGTEYRFYISDKKILDYTHYVNRGHILTQDTIEFVKELINTENILDYFNNIVNHYSVDINVFNNINSVIEFNDGWALGNYLFDFDPYIRLLIKRFNEIIKC